VSHFGPDTNEWAELEKQFRAYGANGRCRTRRYLHGDDEAARCGQEPGSFTPWVETPADTDLLFYEGLHGCVKTDDIDVARHADLKIGVVPIINLEWIQKLHREHARSRLLEGTGGRRGPAAHARLHPLHRAAVLRDRHQLSSACRSSTPATPSWRATSPPPARA
jgi:hypothetical protein